MNISNAYMAAWRIAPKLSLRFVQSIARLAADGIFLLNPAPVRLMRKNHARLIGEKPTRRYMRSAVRSHFRNYAEQFAMEALLKKNINDAVVCDKLEMLRELSVDGPVVAALTHSGNWDLAGAWLSAQGLPVVTVAEKLDPPELFDAFVQYRLKLGMTILGVSKGESVFTSLLEFVRDKPHVIVPLLADRDISGAGIEVNFGGQHALVAAGPAALAQRLGCPLVGAVISYEDGARIRIDITDVVEIPQGADKSNKVEAQTQEWVDKLLPLLRSHVQDWHMMQPVFVDDLDPKRLARARERHIHERVEKQKNEDRHS